MRQSVLVRLEPRGAPSRWWAYGSPLLALALTLVATAMIFTALGKDPGRSLYTYFVAPLASATARPELLVKAAPLVLIAVGLSLGFRANVWNIGAEGQYTLGAIAGGGVALFLPESESPLLLPAMIAAGALGGMLWAAIPAFLRTRFNANEILTSLMLVYVANLFLSWLVHEPWRDPEGFNFPQTKQFADSALYPILVEGTRLNLGFLLALAAVALGYVFLNRSFLGFQLRVSGLASDAARYAGFNANRMVWLGMLIGGTCAGLAGMGEVAGPIGQLLPSVSPGYGFAAIIVAFVGRLHPIGILLA